MFTKRSAIEAFYYLMAVDGEISEDELSCFEGIGQNIDPENFSTYREDVISTCKLQMENLIDEEDFYDVVSEGLDISLRSAGEDEERQITPRLLVWDMLVIALSNNNYSDYERRLIKHVVRTCHIEKSVFLEMEQMIQTNTAIDGELKYLEVSNRPYSEIRPVVDELESRRKVILDSANALIDDENYIAISKLSLPENTFFTDARDKIGTALNPVAEEISEKTGKFMENAKAALDKVGSSFSENQSKLPKLKFSGFIHKKDDVDNTVSSEEEEEE